MNKKKTIIFIGASGAGKGTQVDILKNKLMSQGEKVLSIGMGECARELFKNKKSVTSKFALKFVEQGKMFPDFLAFYLWGDKMNQEYSSEKHLFLDGIPRNLPQANFLEDALKFYEIEKPIIIYLSANLEILQKRILERGRSDDQKNIIKNRFLWFEKDVRPVLDFFKKNEYYDYQKIDGEQSIEEIAQEIEKIILD